MTTHMPDPGAVFVGYASRFGETDAQGDMVLPGAFRASLKRLAREGRRPPMYAQHGAAFGADALPIGVWERVTEDHVGLAVVGRLLGLDTDPGRRLRALVDGGALNGLSIGYRVVDAVRGPPAGPRRWLRQLDLIEISLVADPALAGARITGWKAAHPGDPAGLVAALGRATRALEP
jgi:hypothetical protein